MEIIIKGTPSELAEYTKNALSSASRQDATNIISDKMLFQKNDY